MTNARSHLLALILLAFVALNATAVPAKPGRFEKMQPDGSTLEVMLVGDEFSHYLVSEDSCVIMRDDSGFFVYAAPSADGQMIEATDVRVNPVGRRGAAELEFVASLDRNRTLLCLANSREKYSSKKMRRRVAPQRASYPTVGEQRGLVILVEYSDVKFVTPNARVEFSEMLNQEGYQKLGATGSARDWFVDNSMGKFVPTFDVYGPVALPNDMAYYGANNTSGDDVRAHEMIIDACNLLDDEIDFSVYDRDSDGFIDNVFVFYAGYGENLGGKAPDECVWPHSWDISEATTTVYMYDGVRLDHYACTNEIDLNDMMDGIGTFCHEFSHVLGLPDLYATNYSFAYTPGEWSVMDAGPYNNNSRTPPYYSAYERYALGWLEPKEIGRPDDIRLADISQNEACIIPTERMNEYFMLENRQQNGWDKYIPGHGMLIWHIDYNEAVWRTNTVNNKKSHQYVDIEEADGMQTEGTVDGDSFPGSSNVTSFTDETTPNMLSWNNVPQNKPITEISEIGGVITFKVSGGRAELLPVTALPATEVAITSFRANWERNEAATGYMLSVYKSAVLPSGKVSITYLSGYENLRVGDVTGYDVTGLEPATEYRYVVRCCDDEINMESVQSNEITVVTADPTFDYLSPVATDAVDVTDGSFVATWESLEGATGYILNVYTKNLGEPEVQTVDFTGGLAALPEGWSTNSKLTYSSENYSGISAPSLRLAVSDAYVATPDFGAEIRSFSFWHRGVNAADGSLVVVRGLVDGKWEEIASIPVVNEQGGAVNEWNENDMDNRLPNSCTSVRLDYFAAGKGSLAIDDITVGYSGDYSIEGLDGYVDLQVGDVLQQSVTGVKSGRDYYYRVTATDGTLMSKPSNEVRVRSVSGIVQPSVAQPAKVLKSHDGVVVEIAVESAVGVFDTQGRVIYVGALPAGRSLIPVDNGGIFIVKVGGEVFKVSGM